MPNFIRPTLTEILARVQSDIDSRLPGSDSRLKGSVLNVVSFIEAGIAHGLYGFITWISLQAFPDTAELEFLNRWGAIWGVIRKPAFYAEGDVIFNGTLDKVIPEGTILQRADGVRFLTVSEITIPPALTITTAVKAEIPGDAGNTDAGIILNLISPIDGVQSDVTVDSSNFITGGTDIEDDASYLARLLDRIQQPPHGGNENDYKQWMLALPGVTRVWVYPLELGIGTVTVRFMMDDIYADGIPLPADVANAQSIINLVKPVTAEVFVLAPTPVALNFTIDLLTVDTSEIRASVEANLKDLILRDSEPGGTIRLSRINEAISLAEGEYDHTLVAPSSNVVYSTGQIAVMGVITWA